MILKRKDLNYLRVIFNYKDGNNDFKFFFCSDIHYDNPKCQRQKFIDDLKKIQDRNGYFIIFGDLFCMMQGRKDRRHSKSSLDPDLRVDDYYDSTVQMIKEALMPFKDNLICISDGNHETAVLKNIEIDPVKMLIRSMGLDPAVQHMPYLGYIDLVFENMTGGNCKNQKIFYDHGGYHGEASKGTLSVQRYSAMSNDADIVCSGDTHHRWIVPHHIYDINTQTGKMSIKEQIHLKCGTYKEEFAKGAGWAVEKIKFPKGMGGIHMDIEVSSSKIERTVYLKS